MLVGSPALHGEHSLPVAPAQVVLNGLLLCVMVAEVRSVQGELFEGRKVALDAVEPGGLRRREVEANLMSRRPRTDFGLEMRTIVIHHDVQDLLTRITSANPLEERQKLHPSLAGGELAVEPIGLEVVDRQEMPHAAVAMVVGP